MEVEQAVSVAGGATSMVTVDASKHAELRLKDPQLWWPVGYGEPHLYDVEISFESAGAVLDKKRLKFGIRQMTSSAEGGELTPVCEWAAIYLSRGELGIWRVDAAVSRARV